MSADSLGLRKGGNMTKLSGKIVRPTTAVSERTLMESVAGLINEVGLVGQPQSNTDDKENKILWTRIEQSQNFDLKSGNEGHGRESSQSPLLITLGYAAGVQMWTIPPNGEAQEILSWRRPGVRLIRLLPAPQDLEKDSFRASRPIVALFEGSSTSPSCTNILSFISLRSGESLKSSKFLQPLNDLKANNIAVVISFPDKIVILDPYKFDIVTTITFSQELVAGNPSVNPIALGCAWLAFADRKVYPSFQSAGGNGFKETPSYTATVLYAAKSLTKGLKGLGETVANSIAGHRIPQNPDSYQNSTPDMPGVVTVLNLLELKGGGEFSFSEMSCANGSTCHSSIIAHFVAHQHAILAISFDASGLLLVTADKSGHDFNVFRIHPHPLGSSMGAVHHLYILHRGDTGAKVQNISFAPDSRWVAVSTMRGTTHIFPITPYGGAISVRTHTSHRVVNRLSRFHRSAGLDDTSTSGRNSPVMSFSPSSSNSSLASGGKPSLDLYHLCSPYPNPRLPPFPHPVVVHPLAQLRQSFVNNMSSTAKSSSPTSKAKGSLPYDERIHVNSLFAMPRGWVCSGLPIVPSCDNRKKSPVEALFVLTSYGNLVEYAVEPIPHSGIPKEKISEDTQIELSVHATAQWNFTKPSFTNNLQPPLQPNNIFLMSHANSNGHSTNYSNSMADKHMNSYDTHGGTTNEIDDGTDERWLSQVEISTHCGPHRRLWMGPQFTFKVFNSVPNSKSQGGMVDVETVEVNCTNRPAKSNPVNMPISSSLLPEVIAGSSGSSLEQSPRLVDSYCDPETCAVTNESLIKENLAEAMMENCSISRENGKKGGCQSLGSCDDLSSTSFESTSQNSMNTPLGPTFSIDLGFPE